MSNQARLHAADDFGPRLFPQIHPALPSFLRWCRWNNLRLIGFLTFFTRGLFKGPGTSDWMMDGWPDPLPVFIARLTPRPFPAPIAPITWATPVTGISPSNAQQVEQSREWPRMIDARLFLRINRSWSGHPNQRTTAVVACGTTSGRKNQADCADHKATHSCNFDIFRSHFFFPKLSLFPGSGRAKQAPWAVTVRFVLIGQLIRQTPKNR